MNLYNIANAFERNKLRGWPAVYFAIDIHDTIFKGTYKKNNDDKEFYPWAKEVLQNLSLREDVKLIIYTAGHTGPTEAVVKWLESHDIKIFAINENPDHKGTDLTDFSKKFYFDIMLEDKAGFEGWRDWFLIMKELQRIDQWIPAYKDDCFEISIYSQDRDTWYTEKAGPSSFEHIQRHRDFECNWDCPVCNFTAIKHIENETHQTK